MGEERETTKVIRRLQAIAATMRRGDPGPGPIEVSGIGLELEELAEQLESIDARYERQERVQPGDGPAPGAAEGNESVRRPRKPGGRPSTRRPDAGA